MRNIGICVTLISLAIFSGGCGDDSLGKAQTVTGVVTLDGKPLPDTRVTFHSVAKGLPADRRSFEGKTDAEGKYRLDGVYPAEYDVGFDNRPPAAPPDPTNMPPAVPVPQPLSKYFPGASELKAKVEPGKSQFDFALTDSTKK